VEFIREGNHIALRLEKGEDVKESVERLAEEQGLGFCSISGIGALEGSTLAYLGEDGLVKHDFPERREFMCLGNLSLKDGKHFAHLHAWLGDAEKDTKCGHLVKGRVAVTCELVLTLFEKRVLRKMDPETNYPVLDLSA